MLDNYNLFNNDKVDDLTSTFLGMECYKPKAMEEYIARIIEYYNLKMYCRSISFSDSNMHYLGSYSYKQREILINYKRIIGLLENLSTNNYFIAANVYRIILHEIKHILQHKLVCNKDDQLYQLFQHEFHNGHAPLIGPSEVNADIESSLVIMKNYSTNNCLYNQQLSSTYSLISSFHIPRCIVNDYCRSNNICFLHIDLINRFLYGFDTELTSCKNQLQLKK